jgi:abortive infection bacteriophage resistance protein
MSDPYILPLQVKFKVWLDNLVSIRNLPAVFELIQITKINVNPVILNPEVLQFSQNHRRFALTRSKFNRF